MSPNVNFLCLSQSPQSSQSYSFFLFRQSREKLEAGYLMSDVRIEKQISYTFSDLRLLAPLLAVLCDLCVLCER